MNTKICISIILTIVCKSAISGWFGPSNYDECVIEGMKGVNGDIAARAIIKSCLNKFPPPPPPPTAEELEKERARAEALAKDFESIRQQKEIEKRKCIERVKKQRQSSCEDGKNIYICTYNRTADELNSYPECLNYE